METRYPVEGSSGSEFPALWGRKTFEILWEIFELFGKTTPYGKTFKILFRKFSSRHRLALLCSNFVKFGRR